MLDNLQQELSHIKEDFEGFGQDLRHKVADVANHVVDGVKTGVDIIANRDRRRSTTGGGEHDAEGGEGPPYSTVRGQAPLPQEETSPLQHSSDLSRENKRGKARQVADETAPYEDTEGVNNPLYDFL